MRKSFILFLVLLGILCAGSASAEVYVNAQKPSDWEARSLLRLTVFRFHANDAMLLECGGETMLIDGGVRTFYPKLHEALSAMGKTDLTWIFNSHPHSDHIGAQNRLIRHDLVTAKGFISPFSSAYRNEEHQQTLQLLTEKGIPFIQMHEGEQMMLGDAELTLLQWLDGKDPNALSGVLHVRYGNATMLLTGDLSGKGQNWFVEHYPAELLDCDVLKYPHHALVQMPPDFLNAVSPAFLFITNSMKSTLPEIQLAQASGAEVMCNEAGRITLETDGTDWYIVQEKGVI